MIKEITPADRTKLDEINTLMYAAWRIWTEYFDRDPKQAAQLMIKTVRDLQDLEEGVVKANENNPTG